MLLWLPAGASAVGGDEFHSDSGGGKTWWDVKRRDYPDCAGLVDRHEQMTKELYRLNGEANRAVEPQRKQLVQQINDLSRQRSAIQRQIFECIRTSTKNHPDSTPTLQGKIEKGDRPSDDPGTKQDKEPPGTDPITPPGKKVTPPEGGLRPKVIQPPPFILSDHDDDPREKRPPGSPQDPSHGKTLSGGAEKGGSGGGTEGGPPAPPKPPVLQSEIKKICNLKELALLVDERYKTGNPIAVYTVTNRGPGTYLVLLAGTELMRWYQANHGLAAVKAYMAGVIPDPADPYMSAILGVLGQLPPDSKLIIAGHSQGGMQGLNALRFLGSTPRTKGFFVDQVITFGSPVTQLEQRNPARIVAGQNVPRFTFVEVDGDPIPQAGFVSHEALRVPGPSSGSWIQNHLHYKESATLGQYDVFGIQGGKACLYLDGGSLTSYRAPAVVFRFPPLPGAPQPAPTPAEELGPSGIEPIGNWRKATPTADEYVELWHGSRGHATTISKEGFVYDTDRVTYFGNSRAAAENALRDAVDPVTDGGIFRAQIPKDLWNRAAANNHIFERPYSGFGSKLAGTGTLEYRPNTAEMFRLINTYVQKVK
jgi:hypothetical protein